ncbi:MAG TPA: hypothetical protein VJQ81_20080 [Reyranella sp.]|nr:hypothetical protein [Reyranella sp.]
MTPLDEFRARWIANTPPLPPFVDVINTNVETDQLPATWGSALLTATARTDTTMGSRVHVEESGEIVAALFARSGTGVAPLDAAVAALRSVFHGYMTVNNQLQFRAVVGPQDIDPMAEGEWWRLAFIVPYVVWSVRVEPVPVVAAQDWRG